MPSEVQALVCIHPKTPRFTNILAPGSHIRVTQLCVWTYVANREPPSTQSPFALHGTICSRDDFQSHLERHYSSFIAHTGSCVRPSPSHRLVFLVRRVFAGCYQSLLGVGPSRHYLCNPCVGAWTHTPPCLSGASTHFFPESNGLTPRETRSAHETVPAMRLPQGAVFRGCSHSITFRLLHSLGLQVAPTAKQ